MVVLTDSMTAFQVVGLGSIPSHRTSLCRSVVGYLVANEGTAVRFRPWAPGGYSSMVELPAFNRKT